MTDPILDAIDAEMETAVTEPQSSSFEGESVNNRSLSDLIAAAKYRGAQNAVNSTNPISCRRQKFPGASGLQPGS